MSLPDLVRWYAGTRVRTGEALAVHWSDLDLDTGSVDWAGNKTFRQQVATILDDAGLSARDIADQLGHSKASTTQEVYMGRKVKSRKAADALSVVQELKCGESVEMISLPFPRHMFHLGIRGAGGT